jgi:hypothetical protein
MIDYGILAKAISFYGTQGFKEIDVPWIVSRCASDITTPSFVTATSAVCNSIDYEDPVLVGSAEQSFLQMRLDGNLPDGKYQATSPCFRDESDETHFPYFMKNELIWISSQKLTIEQCYRVVLEPAFDFMKSVRGSSVYIEKTDKGCDIMIGSLELGSYGVRYHRDIGYWIYGTGVALPRISMILP